MMLLSLTTGAVQAAKVHVFLIGGQSNADGRASVGDLSRSELGPQSDVAIYWATSDNGSSTIKASGYDLLKPGLSNSSGSFGPEIAFGRAMADFYAPRGESVALIKAAQGGTNLHTQWKAGADGTTAGDGYVYQLFQQVVGAGLPTIQAEYPPGGMAPAEVSVDGMIWMQGESDLSSTASGDYKNNLTNLISDVRATYGADLPFVIGQLSVNQTAFNATYLNEVRYAQAAVAAADPKSGLVVTDTFSLKGDNIHFDAAGQKALGYGFAAAMQTLVSVPEPSTCWLGVVGLLATLVQIRRPCIGLEW